MISSAIVWLFVIVLALGLGFVLFFAGINTHKNEKRRELEQEVEQAIKKSEEESS